MTDALHTTKALTPWAKEMTLLLSLLLMQSYRFDSQSVSDDL